MRRLTTFALLCVICLATLLLALPSCSTRSTAPDGAQLASAVDNRAAALAPTLAKLAALPTPPGADAAAFSALKAEFRRMLLSGELQRKPSSKGTSAGLGVEVDDLGVVDNGGGNLLLKWSYRQQGDYDQNGEVNVADLSPIGMYFLRNTTDIDWQDARLADGDGNGEVNIGDLTPLGQNFGSLVTGYRVESSATPADPASWALVAEVPFSAGSIITGSPFWQFNTTLSGQAAGLSYRVVATWSGGPPAPTFDEVEDNDSAGGAQALAGSVSGFSGSLGSGAGYSAYDGDAHDYFSFTAATGQDLDITLALNSGSGDLDLYLLNGAGDTLLASEGTGDTEHIAANVTSGGTFVIHAQCYSGYSDYTLGLSITGGGGGFVEPPVENFVDQSQGGDSAARKWLLNCYRPLPAWQDADRVFQSDTFRQWADEVLTLTNQQREANGLPDLIFDPHLELVAQAHARDMALENYFDHVNLYGMSPFDRLDAVNRPAYTPGENIAGENILAGRQDPSPYSGTPQMALDNWMVSPGHRANILNPNVTHLGVGVYYLTDDPREFYVYFVQLFANWSEDTSAHDWLEPAEVQGP